MKLFTKNKRVVRSRGVALLMAILISSVALIVGMGVYNRTYKQTLFSSIWKQTQVAFATADSGLECAMYWDKKLPLATSATCFGSVIAGWDPSLGLSASFINIPVASGCVNVTIDKSIAPDGFTVITTIRSRGRNTCSVAARVVERGVGVQY